jgi:prolyl-tRNA editing enzyme YbaK/EbsC (Cys-tRNA(Pro) deacylase)
VSPREKNQKKLVDNIGIRNIEVMFEGGKVNVSVELTPSLASKPLFCSSIY